MLEALSMSCIFGENVRHVFVEEPQARIQDPAKTTTQADTGRMNLGCTNGKPELYQLN